MKVEPEVTLVLQSVVVYGIVMLLLGSLFQFYRRETKSGFALLGLSMTMLVLKVIATYLRSRGQA